MSSANPLHAAVAGNLQVFRNWVAVNNGCYIYPNTLIIALVHETRYIYIAANILSQIQGSRFAGVEFLDEAATPFFREALLKCVVPTE